MSYDLLVYVPSIPNGLRAAWLAAIGKTGIEVDVHPDFDAGKHAGYLAWKLKVPNADAFRFAPRYGGTPVEVGFDLKLEPADIDLDEWATASPEVLKKLESAEEVWTFSNPAGGHPADFRLLWSAAATLAALTDGVLSDPQEDRSFTGEEALEEAAFQADKYEEEQRDDWSQSAPFTAW